ncbi:hypothetical protein K491DRAFT_699725 [Lophiostoma macrostomum CBS 122681]|uniref:Cytochrome b5 heme-binding domain-containing protein n=1 Tax=Lophiostoma macrostomum CBS 122681 TaxID=1314788 RepID=A0A6A6SHQ1_9PLEO|nr:hypothetical protein K491DRAFT_699725 [Lophiostoma macrostomum CBS 122681]
MGWMRAQRNDRKVLCAQSIASASPCDSKDKLASDQQNRVHIEDISTLQTPKHLQCPTLPFVSTSTPNADLPFLPATAITASPTHNQLYIVIDNIVYNCSSFVDEHPGGGQVIESFRAQDCSWQFWRFHSKDVMQAWGQPLRVARTEGVTNRWKERPRWVGLRRFRDRDEG